MSVQIRRRRESAAFLSTFVGAQGELIVDTTNNRVQVHDGATPGGWPAAKLSEVVPSTRTAVANANYTALATDRTLAVTSLTAARAITLPAASAYPTGTQLIVVDESGACSATNSITITRAGTDTINGGTSAVISAAYGYLALESDGASKWTIVDQATAGVAAGTFLPTASFGTPGDLAVSYATQAGTYYQVGKLVFVAINLVFTPTYSTASGAFRLGGLPVTGAANGLAGALQLQQLFGSTAIAWPANGTSLVAPIGANGTFATIMTLKSSGSSSSFTTTQFVAGNAITLILSGVYLAA